MRATAAKLQQQVAAARERLEEAQQRLQMYKAKNEVTNEVCFYNTTSPAFNHTDAHFTPQLTVTRSTTHHNCTRSGENASRPCAPSRPSAIVRSGCMPSSNRSKTSTPAIDKQQAGELEHSNWQTKNMWAVRSAKENNSTKTGC
jgi:hypothetical protein